MCLLQAVVDDGCFAATLTASNSISISDMGAETSERLDFRDAVVKMAIGGPPTAGLVVLQQP